MFPVLIDFGTLSIGNAHVPLMISSYGVCYLAAILLGYWMFQRLGARYYPTAPLGDVYLGTIVASFLGGKLTNLVVEWRLVVEHPASLVGVALGGGHFLGGVTVGLVTCFLLMRKYRLQYGPILNTFFAAVPVCHAIGRLGCFLGGCCYGAACEWPWGVIYTDERAHRFNGTPLGTPLHPTQLYEAAAELFNFFVVLRVFRNRPRPFQVFAVWTWLYGFERFLLEFLRTDERGAYTVLGLTLSTSQWLSIGFVALGTGLFIAFRKSAPTPLAADAPPARAVAPVKRTRAVKAPRPVRP